MNNNAFYKAHPLFNHGRLPSKRWFSKHWQSFLGLSLLFFIFFSLYSPIKGYHIDTTQEQMSDDVTSPTLRDSETPPSPCDWPVKDIVVDTLFISVAPDETLASVQRTLQADGAHDLVVEKFWPELNLALVRLPEQNTSPVAAASFDATQRLEKYRQALENIPAIQYVDYNGWVSVPAWTGPYQSAHSEYARRLSTDTVEYVEQDYASTEEVVIALIDSGYGITDTDTSTYSLWENQAEIDGIFDVDDDNNGFVDDYNGWDWIDNDNVMDDGHGHGTLIGDAILDVIEQQGVDRRSVKIQPLRILREDGKGEIADLVDALVYAARKGISIVNLSMVSYYNAPALEEAIAIVHEQGLLAISPAGPCSRHPYWPAAYPATFATSAVCNAKTSDDICHTNELADIAVQFDVSDVISTSSASLGPPHVTAAAALILGKRPDSSNIDMESLILSTAFSLEDSPVEILVLDIEAIVEELETLGPSLNVSQVGKKLYLPLITN